MMNARSDGSEGVVSPLITKLANCPRYPWHILAIGRRCTVGGLVGAA